MIAMFGRSDDEWDGIIDVAIQFLKDQARLRRITSYTELNAALGRRGCRIFDFTQEGERRAVGSVLAQVTQRTIGDTGIMLSEPPRVSCTLGYWCASILVAAC